MKGTNTNRLIGQVIILAVSLLSTMAACQTASREFRIKDMGKDYSLPTGKLVKGLYHHIEQDDDVIGGNTSIRNVDAKDLEWKGNPNGNGYGYFERNRDLGQVFTMPKNMNVTLDALVLRTSRGNNAIMNGTPGAALYIVFYEVKTKKGEQVSINENGTTKGDQALHGFDLQFNRADDFIEGATYVFLDRFTGGIFPEIAPTSQYVYDNGKGGSFGEQKGHLHYFRCDFLKDAEITLEAGKTYAFMIGFSQPGDARGLALAIDSEVHTKEAAAFVRDENGAIRWGIRREGNGTIPPTMISQSAPPKEKTESYNELVSESLFPKDHDETLTPTSNGYPDVDTYRTLQFYLEIKDMVLINDR